MSPWSDDEMPDRNPRIAGLAGLRQCDPPPERPGLRGELLAAFDRTQSGRRRPGWWRRAVAAAVLLIVASQLIDRERPVSIPRVGEDVAALVELQARLDRIELGIRRLDRQRQARAVRTASEGSTASTSGIADALPPALAESDPALLRLMSARPWEAIDPAVALARYGELLELFPLGPAASVARDRIARLSR